MRRVIFRPKGGRFITHGENNDHNWTKVWPPPANPTKQEQREAHWLAAWVKSVFQKKN